MAKKPKTTGQLIKQLQPIFNKFIRERDKDEPCVSCGDYNLLQAGHFYAVGGYSGLRFDEDNVHGECARCNCWDESHLIGYAENLKKKIGEKRFYELRERAMEYKKNGVRWSRVELREKIEYYKNQIR